MKDLFLDIETQPLDEKALSHHLPEKGKPEEMSAFDPSSVKIGNLKDKAKIDAKLESARLEYEKKQADLPITHHKEWEARCENIKANAALSPITGKIFGMGFRFDDSTRIRLASDPDEKTERMLIESFYAQLESNQIRRIFGWNILGFDLPFIVTRSIMLGIRIPFQSLPRFSGQPLKPHFSNFRALPDVYDLQAEFVNMGLSKAPSSDPGKKLSTNVMPSLNHALGILGLGEKVDLEGKQHFEAYRDNPDQFEEYFRVDVERLESIAEKLQFIRDEEDLTLARKTA